ncbi:cytochrome P450 [Polyangium aurulentum]|uniref:cytochrome P450 n=1 Tax=Polyangium aurulentum TaxID=2567896 RepID=UPI0010ADD46A|nr:cytochrome P450 [Polyangium aurulentum]UQA59155.1 cytochrome P450 [Polyangium aurulentum]
MKIPRMIERLAGTPVRSREGAAASPPGVPVLGHLPRIRREGLLEFLADSRRVCGDVFRIEFGPFPSYVICHPDMLEHVLVRRARFYPKGRAYDLFRRMVGNGLVTAEGEAWRKQRRMLQPSFNEGEVRAFMPAMLAELGCTAERFERAAARGETLDMGDEMARLSMGVVTRTVLGHDVEDRLAIDRAMRSLFAHMDAQRRLPLPLPLWAPTPGNVEFRRTKAAMDDLIRRTLRAKRRAGCEGRDLCSLLLRAHDESSGEKLDDQQIVDEVFTLFLAGYETTGRSLAWAFHHLTDSPALAAQMAAEADAAFAGREPDAEALGRMRHTMMFVAEVLRLYPPAWAVVRDALEDDVIGGTRIPKGASVMLPIWLTHRHPDFWPDPERFDPQRFSPERMSARHRLSYVPFSAGARMCIGNHLALQEMKLALGYLLQRFHFEPASGERAKCVGEPLLAWSRPIRARVTCREDRTGAYRGGASSASAETISSAWETNARCPSSA